MRFSVANAEKLEDVRILWVNTIERDSRRKPETRSDPPMSVYMDEFVGIEESFDVASVVQRERTHEFRAHRPMYANRAVHTKVNAPVMK